MSAQVSDHDAAEFVAARFGAMAGPVSLCGAGEWSRAYAFCLGTQNVVIRFGGHRDDFEKDKIMARLGAPAGRTPRVPIPPVLEIGETPWGHYIVSERRYGDFLDDLNAAGMRVVLPALLETLDAIGDLEPPANGYGPWDRSSIGSHDGWREFLLAIADDRPRIAGWRAALDTRPREAAVFADGLAALRRDIAAVPEQRRIVHGDLLNRNVLVDGSRVTAVLDWGNAMYGDPLYDAARLIFFWPWYPQWTDIDIRTEVTAHWGCAGEGNSGAGNSGIRKGVAGNSGAGNGRELTDGVRNAGLPPGFDGRLRVYLLHIGLDALAYNAFKGRWDELARNAELVDGLLHSDDASR